MYNFADKGIIIKNNHIAFKNSSTLIDIIKNGNKVNKNAMTIFNT